LGRQLGPHTGDPCKFTSIEDFKEAYLKQVSFFVDKMVQIHHIEEELKRAYLKRPLVSAHLDGCIEQGKDGRDFVPYNGWAVENNIKVAGMISVADSLTAIKKLVFDDKVVTIEGLLEAVRNDWEGKEDLRQRCLNVPKYGNDDDYADEMAQWVHYATQAEVRKFKCYSGTELWIEGSVISAYYALGRFCPATPDGRTDSQPFADGTGSPTAGADTHGPTATLCSLGKIDTQRAHGMLFNQKFMPQSLEGENKKLFAHYLRTWYDLGIYHVQFNVVDRAVLLDAQAHPQKYPDLVVRVAGYSAYWADLGKPLQDDIIKRTEQCFA
jgi:pyruvate-formate lyase